MATETIIGNYRIVERIGRGGMGVVYKGTHLKLPREVAIKSIGASSSKDLRRLRSRFEKEAFIQSQLDHPGIVKIYDYIVSSQTYHIVMEFVEGRSLAELLQSEVRPLPVQRALNLFEQILAAMIFAQECVYQDQNGARHVGLIHRDLKPANILITSLDQVKISDFGIVKLVGSEKTHSGTNYGSPEYVSPEQAQGTVVDPRSDIYSLGIILYEMLTGQPPFHSEGGKRSQLNIVRAQIAEPPRPPSQINSEITDELEAVILRSIAKAPKDRFASAREFLSAIHQINGGQQSLVVPNESAASQSSGKGPTSEIVGPTIRDPTAKGQTTQRVYTRGCPACGEISESGDLRCRRCGRELTSSRATVELTRKELEIGRRTRALALLLGAGAAIAALVGILIYLAASR